MVSFVERAASAARGRKAQFPPPSHLLNYLNIFRKS